MPALKARNLLTHWTDLWACGSFGEDKKTHFSSSFSESLVAVFNLLVHRHLEFKLGRANECCSCLWKAVLFFPHVQIYCRSTAPFSLTQFNVKNPFFKFSKSKKQSKDKFYFLFFYINILLFLAQYDYPNPVVRSTRGPKHQISAGFWLILLEICKKGKIFKVFLPFLGTNVNKYTEL